MKIRRIALSLTLAMITLTARAALTEDTSSETDADIPGGITLGIHANDMRARGLADAMIPIWQNEDTLIFFNPRVSFNDAGEEELNIGMGWRGLFADDTLILGANAFYDTRWSSYNNRFDQVGAGLELLSSWFDARVNYYYPDDKQELIEEIQTVEEETTTAVYTRTPYLDGSTILQDRLTVMDTTTTTRWWEMYETALEGFDAEIGARLPVLTNFATTRIFIGYQSFDNPFGGDLEGLKGRAEMRFGESLLLDVEVFENEELNEAKFFAGVRLRLPFSIGNLVSGENPFEKASQHFRPRSSSLASRLGEMVIRDMNVRLTGSRSAENPNRGTQTTTQTSSTEILTIGEIIPPAEQPPEEEPPEEEPPIKD